MFSVGVESWCLFYSQEPWGYDVHINMFIQLRWKTAGKSSCCGKSLIGVFKDPVFLGKVLTFLKKNKALPHPRKICTTVMPGARQNFSHRLRRIHPLVLLELWRELLHKAAVEVVGRGQCLLVAGILLTYQSTEACLRNKFSFYLSTKCVHFVYWT